jgi:hypothetical protein
VKNGFEISDVELLDLLELGGGDGTLSPAMVIVIFVNLLLGRLEKSQDRESCSDTMKNNKD